MLILTGEIQKEALNNKTVFRYIVRLASLCIVNQTLEA